MACRWRMTLTAASWVATPRTRMPHHCCHRWAWRVRASTLWGCRAAGLQMETAFGRRKNPTHGITVVLLRLGISTMPHSIQEQDERSLPDLYSSKGGQVEDSWGGDLQPEEWGEPPTECWVSESFGVILSSGPKNWQDITSPPPHCQTSNGTEWTLRLWPS